MRRAPRSGRRALHAEWTKLRTSPGALALTLAVVVSTVGSSAAAAAATAGSVAGCASGSCGPDLTRLSLTGVQVGQAVVAVLAVLLIGDEYGTGMVRVTLTALPRRTTVLAAKAVVVAGVVTVTAVPAVLGSLAAGWLVLPGRAFSGHEVVARAAVGSVLYLVLVGLLGLGTATAVRSPAAAAGIVLGLLYVFPIVAQAVTDPGWRRHLEQVGPMSAGLAVQATGTGAVGAGGAPPIGPWQGLGVLALWALAALLTGGLLLARRDA
ncbi:ABC transporter permease [Parafrankia discariae]|uniref:ABC transporter permease n=1 Tax=Parafrankia discariae TaxID=365528 RepID=UPI00037E3A65|nr:ABC transporter permease [Parafrankia discariae]